MTNEEKIKNLTTEELARKLSKAIHCSKCPIFPNCKAMYGDCSSCEETWLQWLKKEVKE